MANKEMKARIVHKHDIEANWKQATGFTPLEGEIIVYDAEVEGDSLPTGRFTRYEYARFKIGNGNDNVNDLPFAGADELEAALDNYLLKTEAEAFVKNLNKSYNYGLEGYTITAGANITTEVDSGLNFDPTDPQYISNITLTSSASDNGRDTAASSFINVWSNTENGYSGIKAEGDSFTFNNSSIVTEESIKSLEIGVGKEGAGTNAEIFNDYANNQATNNYAHAEGQYTWAKGKASHAEGSGYVIDLGITLDTTGGAILEGSGDKTCEGTLSSAQVSVGDILVLQQTTTGKTNRWYDIFVTTVDDVNITFIGEIDVDTVYNVSKAIPNEARGDYSHVSGLGTIAAGEAQTVVGKYNEESEDALFVVGSGTSDSDRRNVIQVSPTNVTLNPGLSGEDYSNVAEFVVEHDGDRGHIQGRVGYGSLDTLTELDLYGEFGKQYAALRVYDGNWLTNSIEVDTSKISLKQESDYGIGTLIEAGSDEIVLKTSSYLGAGEFGEKSGEVKLTHQSFTLNGVSIATVNDIPTLTYATTAEVDAMFNN